MPWVNPDECLDPAPVTLPKMNEADERLLAEMLSDTDSYTGRGTPH
jgi:hypothetical protein